ncbi:MAG: potassium transporter TrkG [Candidatus Altiarchaeota archaeon]|nr:potassium transporter TrkG [Candidatus Altiarchaeota archaeon]
MNVKNILWYLGVFLIVEGLLSILHILVALVYHEPCSIFFLGVILPLVAGLILTRYPPVDLDFGDAMLLSSMVLIFISLFGAFPFFSMFQGNISEVFVDGYFESVSSYTTTGLTVLPQEAYTAGSTNYHSLVFKRTISEWLGGLGIIVLFLSILAKGNMSSVYLYQTVEGMERVTPSVEHTAQIILRIYLFYTLVGVILLWIFSDLNLFHSSCAVLSAIASGGFIGAVFKANSIVVNDSGQFIMMLVMLIAATPFTLHHFLLSGKLKKFFKNIEIRTMFIILFMSVFLFSSLLWLEGMELTVNRIFQTTLGVVSILTTTGYDSGNILHGEGLEAAGNAGMLLIFLILVIGACSGSTGGGIKIIRFAVMLKAIHWSIKKSSLPESAIIPLKAGGKIWSDRDLDMITLFFFLYTLFIAGGFFILILHHMDPMQALLLSAQSLAMSGLAGTNLALQPLTVKIVLILQMIAGRLEIFPVLALLLYITGNFHRGAKKEKSGIEKRLRFIKRLVEIK